MLGDTPKELYADSYMPPKASQMVQCGSKAGREHKRGQSLLSTVMVSDIYNRG